MTLQRTYSLLALATIFWGIQPLCIKIIVSSWSPAALTCVRYLFISSILFLLCFFVTSPKFFLQNIALFLLYLWDLQE